MAQSTGGPEAGSSSSGTSYCAWFGFWGQFVALGLLAVIGGFFASADAASGDYACGLILALAAIALAFLRLKTWFDAGSGGWANFLFVDDTANLILAIVVFVVLGLGGMIVASGVGYGGLQNGGVALFIVSAIGVLLNLKHVFDIRDRSGRQR